MSRPAASILRAVDVVTGAARRSRLRFRRQLPLLSVVVPAYNAENYLDACLRSLLVQDYPRIEVVVVDDGSTDGTEAIARSYARADRRVRVHSQPNGGVGAARRVGTELARGEFLTYLDADDTATRRGLAAAMESLPRTGSDIAVLRYQRLDGTTTSAAAPWIRALHSRPAERVTLRERPDVLVSALPGGKVFRREFWDSLGIEFPVVVLGGDQLVTATAYRDAAAIDILGVTGHSWRRLATSMSQGHVTPESAEARFVAARGVLELLASVPEVQGARAVQYLRNDLTNVVLKLERADDAYLDALIAGIPPLVAAAPPDVYHREVPAQFRVLYALLAAGDRDRIWRFVGAEGMQPEMHPSGFEPAGLTAYLPGWQVDDVPPEAYVLTAEQTQARVLVRHVRRDGDDLVLDLAAWFPHVEPRDPSLEVKTDGDRVDVLHDGDPYVATSRQGAERRYAGSGWTVILRGMARRTPREITVTLSDGRLTGTASARIPRAPGDMYDPRHAYASWQERRQV